MDPGQRQLTSSESGPKDRIDVGSAFGRVDATGAASEFIAYLDAARKSGPIAQAKLWSFEQLQLTAGQSVLDVGCGTGDDVATLAGVVGSSGRAVGVDSSEAMVSESIRRHGQVPGTSFQLADAERLPLESGSFDACRAERTLQHVVDPERAISEMARVLKPSGRIALIEPDWEGLLLEGSDPDLSAVIWRSRLNSFRQPRIGRRLRTLLVLGGFVEITIQAMASVITDFKLVARNFEIENAAEGAVRAGIVSEHEAERWLSELRNADREGRFLCSALSFRAAGHKT